MKPFDDMLPEETSKEYEPLLALLSHTPGALAPLTSDEQAQAIARVQARLQAESKMPQNENIAEQQAAPVQMLPQRKRAMSPRRKRMLRFINTFAAVLVIGVIIGASLLLFRHQPQTAGDRPHVSVGAPGTIYASRGGLEATLHVTPGPYFLGELLAADMSLANHSHTTFQLAGYLEFTVCNPALRLNLTPNGANTEHSKYTLPMDIFQCGFRMTQLKPGQTITIRQYIPLTMNGNVLLTEEADFLARKTRPDQGTSTTTGSSPLDRHWPSLQINVASHVPSDRIISLQRTGLKIFINAPPAARSHLLYQEIESCTVTQTPVTSGYNNFVGDSWLPLTTMTMEEPRCYGKNEVWVYAVSAPGYTIVTGRYMASSLP